MDGAIGVLQKLGVALGLDSRKEVYRLGEISGSFLFGEQEFHCYDSFASF